jgi:hypothetical protein
MYVPSFEGIEGIEHTLIVSGIYEPDECRFAGKASLQ